MSAEVFLYVQGPQGRGYLHADGSLSAWEVGAQRFPSLGAAHDEIERRGWRNDTSAWEGGVAHAYAAWAFP